MNCVFPFSHFLKFVKFVRWDQHQVQRSVWCEDATEWLIRGFDMQGINQVIFSISRSLSQFIIYIILFLFHGIFYSINRKKWILRRYINKYDPMILVRPRWQKGVQTTSRSRNCPRNVSDGYPCCLTIATISSRYFSVAWKDNSIYYIPKHGKPLEDIMWTATDRLRCSPASVWYTRAHSRTGLFTTAFSPTIN